MKVSVRLNLAQKGALPVGCHDNPQSASLTRDVSENFTDPTLLQPYVCYSQQFPNLFNFVMEIVVLFCMARKLRTLGDSLRFQFVAIDYPYSLVYD